MKPCTVTTSMMFRHPPRFLSMELSFKHECFPTEPSNSMKSYESNIWRNQGRREAQNQHYFHSCSPHIKCLLPVIWVRSFHVRFFSKFAHILHIRFGLVFLLFSFYWCEGEKEAAEFCRGT